MKRQPFTLSYDEIVRKLVGMNVPRETAESCAGQEVAARGIQAPSREFGHGGVAELGESSDERCVIDLHSRLGDGLRLTINLPPRTKKNSTTLGIKQSAAYRHYRDAIIAGVRKVNLLHHYPGAPDFLELPDRALGYNIAAIYYVDAKGRRADKVGLDQGLYDALENAGVVSDDWYFRTADNTRVVLDDPNPRVEVHITPISE